MTLLQHHILALSLTAITTFALGLLVFLADPKRTINRVFAFYAVSISWWAISECFEIGAQDITRVEFWNISKFVGVCFIAPTFLHTVLLVTGDRRKSSQIILNVGYLAGVAFLVLRVCTDLLTGEPRPVAYTNYYTPLTPVGAYLPVSFLVLINVGFFKLWRALRNASGQKRTQLRYLLWGSLIGYAGGSPDWALPFGFHIPFLSPFGIYGVPLYSIALTYALFQHKLFDFHLVIRKSLVYSLLVTSLTVGYFGFVYAVEWLFRTTFGYQSVWLSLAAFALMALVFQPLQVGIQRIVDRLFFHAPHEELARRMERLEQEVRHTDQLKAISTLAAGMAHEIKNPLTSIKTFASYLPEHGGDPAFQEKFQRIVTHEVDKIDHIVRRLLDFARPAAPQLEPVKISQVLDETLELLSNEAVRRRVQVMRAYTPEDAIPADPQQLRQVFLNLFLNSLEAMTPPPARLPGGPAPDALAEAAGSGVNGSGGRLVVSTARQPDRLTVTIQDTGCGIPKEQSSHLFEPFFTTKPTGSGLGLSVAHGIIKEHGGTIRIDSQPNRGTRCTLTFPLDTPSATNPKRQAAGSP